MGEFIRDRLPDPASYFESEGLTLNGAGKWRTTRCEFHGGSDSMRVNTETGGWCCMNCGAKGDLLGHHMQKHGLEFVEAARALGAYVEDNGPHRGSDKPLGLSAREAIQVASFELTVAMVVMADTRAGLIPSDDDWQRFIMCCARVEAVAAEYRS